MESELHVGLKAGDCGEPVMRLKWYLKEFGYLFSNRPADGFGPLMDPDLPETHGDLFDDGTVKALKNLQRFYRLEETGYVTVETLEFLNTPRCGNPDIPRIADSPAGGMPFFFVTGNKWNKTNLTYRLETGSRSLTKDEILAEVRKAFHTWGEVCSLTFTETSGPADIVIEFPLQAHGDGKDFDGRTLTLAHAFGPPSFANNLAGDIHFDNAELWGLQDTNDTTDVQTVALHEIGHSLGLEHSNIGLSVMHCQYQGQRRQLHTDDIDGIQSIYGGRMPKLVLSDTSIAQPAFADLNGKGFLAWSGTNKGRNLSVMTTTDLRVWYNKVILSESSLSGPAIATFKGCLFLAWREALTNALCIISSADGEKWSNKICFEATTFKSPAICEVDDRLILAWTGTDNKRSLNILQSADSINWHQPLQPGHVSWDAPSVCRHGKNLLLSWIDTSSDHHLNFCSLNGTGWTAKTKLTERSFRSPAISNVNGSVMMSWLDGNPDGRLHIYEHFSEAGFENKKMLNDMSLFAPGLGSLSGKPIILWTDIDNRGSINLLCM